jgi:hypothetical protein
LAQLGIENATEDQLDIIADVAMHNVIHAEPMIVITPETIKSAIIVADTIGKKYLERQTKLA